MTPSDEMTAEEELAFALGLDGPVVEGVIAAALSAVRREENEACAKVADKLSKRHEKPMTIAYHGEGFRYGCQAVAQAIRARVR